MYFLSLVWIILNFKRTSSASMHDTPTAVLSCQETVKVDAWKNHRKRLNIVFSFQFKSHQNQSAMDMSTLNSQIVIQSIISDLNIQHLRHKKNHAGKNQQLYLS